MRRVRNFTVCIDQRHQWNSISSIPWKLRPAELTEMEPNPISGWHQSWDAAMSLFATQRCSVLILDTDWGNRSLACFNARNLENATESTKYPRWLSTCINLQADNQQIEAFVNLNCSDYQWIWVAGAVREVPYRLNYIERRAAANPEGVFGRLLSLCAEMRAIFYAILGKNPY